MINTLDEYIWRSLPEYGSFQTASALTKKVDAKGNFLPYCGNTAVFLLEASTKQELQALQDELYSAAHWMLAEKIREDTFHMTLHNLIDGPGKNRDMEQEMAAAQEKAEQLLQQRKRTALHMRATWMFNMVNTSIVLGLAPADEESRRELDAMYCALETVVPLGYALTPHITLAYFRPGVYEQEQVQQLRRALRAVKLDVALRPEALVIQNFEHMNYYETVAH